METGGVDEATGRDVPFLVTMIAILKGGGEGRDGVVGARKTRAGILQGSVFMEREEWLQQMGDACTQFLEFQGDCSFLMFGPDTSVRRRCVDLHNTLLSKTLVLVAVVTSCSIFTITPTHAEMPGH